jgi:predicted nucleic acid-binding protein
MNGLPLCVDANLVIHLVADPGDELVRSTWERWDAEHRSIAAPTLLFYEVSNALYRYQRVGMMSTSAVGLALRAALALPIRLYGEPELHVRALDLADRFSLPAAYDAHYLALADWLGAELWTADLRLARAVEHELPWVRVLDAARQRRGDTCT